jgi:hypothetical protein
MFVTIGNYLINAEQILHASNVSAFTGSVDSGQPGLKIEFIEHGSVFIPEMTTDDLEERLKALAPF